MIHYRSLIGASLLTLCAAAPAFAQQGAAGGSLYKDPTSKSYLPPRVASNQPTRHWAPQRNDRGATTAMNYDYRNSNDWSQRNTTNGDGASGPGDASLIGPKFGGG